MFAFALFALCIVAAVAQPVDLTGQVEVLTLDNPGQSTFHVYHLLVDGHYDTLLFDDASAAPYTGGKYRVQGERTSESTIRVTSCTATTLRSQRKRFRATEVRSLIVVRIAFSGTSYAAAPDAAAVTNMFWDGSTSVDGFFKWVSKGAISFGRDRNGDGQADVYSTSIAQPTICFDIPRLAAAALQQSLGVDMWAWQHHVFVLPPDYTGCGVGVGNLGCNVNACNVYSNMMRGDIFAHELGHNLGLDHANSMNTFGNDPTPRWAEYSDYSSSMSLSLNMPRRGFNPIDLDHLDLLPAASILTLAAPVTTVTRTLADLYADSGVRVIRFTAADGVTYHVSYRQGAASGYDSQLASDFFHPVFPGKWNERVMIHRRDSNGGPKMSFLVAQLTVGSATAWTAPSGDWAVRFPTSAVFQANVLIGTPAQVASGTLGGTGAPTTAATTTTTTTTTTTLRATAATTTSRAATAATTTTTSRAATAATTTTRAPTAATTTTRAPTTVVTTATTAPAVAPQGALFAPGRIEAEFFDRNGFYDTTPRNLGGQFRPNEAVDIERSNEGGFNVGWMAAGEWLEYTVLVKESGWYQTAFRTASESGGGLLYLLMDDYGLAGPVNVVPTNNWQVFRTLLLVERFYIPAGYHKFKLYVYQAGCNLNWWDLVRVDPNAPQLTTGASGAVPTAAPGAPITYAVCGNGRCEAGEDCFSCQSDCKGYMGARVADRFCCSGDRPSGYLESTGWNNLVSSTTLCVPPPAGVLPALPNGPTRRRQ